MEYKDGIYFNVFAASTLYSPAYFGVVFCTLWLLALIIATACANGRYH